MSKLGVVLVDFSGLVGRPAQTLEKTCNMMTDMERKTEMLDHVTGEEDSENLATSVLVGILDQTSREHNETYHEGTRSCEQWEKKGRA